MAVGAYSCYKFMTVLISGGAANCCSVAGFNILLGLWADHDSLVGVLFGLPSLRIKGFYLAVATLAAQFFLVWLFNRLRGSTTTPLLARSARLSAAFGRPDYRANTAAWAAYMFCLFFTICALIARNLTRGRSGVNGWRSATWTSRQRSLA